MSSNAELSPRWNNGQLQAVAPRLHFLSGHSLERLKNGMAVPFDFQLTLFAGSKGTAVARSLERFVVSYDLWEERFSVVRVRAFRRSRSGLTAAGAEAWCLDNLLIGDPHVTPDKPLWLRLEVRSAESKVASEAPDEGGINLATLIEVFSRPMRSSQDHWVAEAGPFRLSEHHE